MMWMEIIGGEKREEDEEEKQRGHTFEDGGGRSRKDATGEGTTKNQKPVRQDEDDTRERHGRDTA